MAGRRHQMMMMKMKMKKSMVGAGRAWNLLRVALLWARKGGVFKNRLQLMVMDLPNKLVKTLHHHHHRHYDAAASDPYAALHYYRERQFSFDHTPMIHVKMHRPSSLRFKLPHIPCIKPHHLDFDFDYDHNAADDDDNDDAVTVSSSSDHEYYTNDTMDDDGNNGGAEGGIDMKAEEFIAKFYKQMKLQRQISYLQYNEMLTRGAN